MPDNIECPDRITRHSEVALASFVEIADDLPVTIHRLSRTVRDTDVARSIVEVFAVARFCAMELITILNRCHGFRGFVYHRARFTSDHKSIEISVRPRNRSARGGLFTAIGKDVISKIAFICPTCRNPT